MPNSLVFSVRFLQPYSHSRGDGGAPEWPPSPLRLLQALVSAAAARWNERQQLEYAAPALRWLESLSPPEIVAAEGMPSEVRTQYYVPDNTAELLVPAWKKGEVDKVPKRTEKVVRPVHLLGEAVHYLYILPDGKCPYRDVLRSAARSMTHLGWGIDMAVGNVDILNADQAAQLDGVRWHPSSAGKPLRVPIIGTLDDLVRKHTEFLNRVSGDAFCPVPPLRAFDVVRYRRHTDPLSHPHAVFRLLDDNEDTVPYPHAKLIHLAGMVRHAAIERMKRVPPRNLRGFTPEQWVDQYVAGHAPRNGEPEGRPHRQFSYVPLPSVGHVHTDPAIRRVMVVAPLGDEDWLEHLAERLDGELLQPLPNTKLPEGTRLRRVSDRQKDGVRDAYTRDAREWASFTPVILPGHDDHKPAKTERLILKALTQSGIDQPCEFEWSAFSQFPKSYSAHKYVRDESARDGRRIVGYLRPDHVRDQTAVHLLLRFAHHVPGPLTLGAGRHCGFGLMAAVG